ncbi:MAG TPA: hypothetical protein VI011_09680, partial [Asanoa sp.]
DRIAGMEQAVWGADRTWIADGLAREIATDPAALTVVVAVDEATDTVVSAGWVRFLRGTAFATLWGGSTLPRWRRRGIYRARRLPGPPRGRPRLHAVAGRRLRRQPPDPRTPRTASGRDDDAVRFPPVTDVGSACCGAATVHSVRTVARTPPRRLPSGGS